MTESETRRRVMEFQAGYRGPAVISGAGMAPGGVTGGPGPCLTAAERPSEQAQGPEAGQKIAKSSAGARSTQTRAGEGGSRQKGGSGSQAPDTRKRATEQEIPANLRTKPDKRENEVMLDLMILRNSLRRNAPACRERARLAGKWVWRDIRLMLTLVNRIQEKLLRTMPESRDEYYSAYARFGHYELKIDGPVRTSRHLLITDKHLATICEAAMTNECVLCMREGAEIGKCALREALLESAAPRAIENGDSPFRRCEYREAAGQLVHGEDVTV